MGGWVGVGSAGGRAGAGARRRAGGARGGRGGSAAGGSAGVGGGRAARWASTAEEGGEARGARAVGNARWGGARAGARAGRGARAGGGARGGGGGGRGGGRAGGRTRGARACRRSLRRRASSAFDVQRCASARTGRSFSLAREIVGVGLAAVEGDRDAGDRVDRRHRALAVLVVEVALLHGERRVASHGALVQVALRLELPRPLSRGGAPLPGGPRARADELDVGLGRHPLLAVADDDAGLHGRLRRRACAQSVGRCEASPARRAG